MNLFGIVKIVGEFIGGGISPSYRIDVIRLTRTWNFEGYLTTTAEVLFVASTFYYLLNNLTILKKVGCNAFFKDAWNTIDVFTIFFSLLTIGLWLAKLLIVGEMVKEIGRTKGNEFVPIGSSQQINGYYDYAVSITVFTSILKFCRLLSFQKAFKQIAATIKLCFIGLSTFVVEFIIVFGSFCCFFFFILSSDLRNFYTFPFTVQNTLAMSIGKFNFGQLRAASEIAAWIFFVFSIVVNMILINMMMAIINMAFEDIKAQGDSFKNKFEIMEYVKRSTKELTGVRMALRDMPRYKDKGADGPEKEGDDEGEKAEEKTVSGEFSEKTNQLLDYIENKYLKV